MVCLKALECIATVLAMCAHVCFALFSYGCSLSGCQWLGQLAAVLPLLVCWHPVNRIIRGEFARPSLFIRLSERLNRNNNVYKEN